MYDCKVYSPEDVLMIKEGRLPGFCRDAIFRQVFIALDGKNVEVVGTVDCPHHWITRDNTRHFCFNQDVIYELDSSSISHFCCMEVCDIRKKIVQDFLDKHGSQMPLDVSQHMRDYIEASNTVSFDVKKEQQRGG